MNARDRCEILAHVRLGRRSANPLEPPRLNRHPSLSNHDVGALRPVTSRGGESR
jgi:hypothetical protein